MSLVKLKNSFLSFNINVSDPGMATLETPGNKEFCTYTARPPCFLPNFSFFLHSWKHLYPRSCNLSISSHVWWVSIREKIWKVLICSINWGSFNLLYWKPFIFLKMPNMFQAVMFKFKSCIQDKPKKQTKKKPLINTVFSTLT